MICNMMNTTFLLQYIRNMTNSDFASETRAKIDDTKTFSDPSYYGKIHNSAQTIQDIEP